MADRGEVASTSGVARLTAIVARAAGRISSSLALGRTASAPTSSTVSASPPTSPKRRHSQLEGDASTDDGHLSLAQLPSAAVTEQTSSLAPPGGALGKPSMLNRLPSQALSFGSGASGATSESIGSPKGVTAALDVPSVQLSPSSETDDPMRSSGTSSLESSLANARSSGSSSVASGAASPSSPAGFRHHRRQSSTNVVVKETLDASSADDPVTGERQLNRAMRCYRSR